MSHISPQTNRAVRKTLVATRITPNNYVPHNHAPNQGQYHQGTQARGGREAASNQSPENKTERSFYRVQPIANRSSKRALAQYQQNQQISVEQSGEWLSRVNISV